MKSIEFYQGFIMGLVDGPSDNEHDNQVYRAITDVLESSSSILNQNEMSTRSKRLVSNLTFFDDQIEKVGAYPPYNDMSTKNISGGFAVYIDSHEMKNDFSESKGINVSKLGDHVSSSSLSKIEYVIHRGLMNEAIREFIHEFMHEVARSPEASCIVNSGTVPKEDKLDKIREMAKNSLSSQVERGRTMQAPSHGMSP